MRVKADELPADLISAFVDALEAWTLVEHDHFMIHQFLTRPATLDEGWEAFTEMSPREQRQATTELMDRFAHNAETRDRWFKLCKRIKGLARKRNRLVHGTWRRVELVSGSRTTGFEYLRIYEGRGAGVSRPTNQREADAELGSTRFYTKELRAAEREFVQLAKDLHWFMSH